MDPRDKLDNENKKKLNELIAMSTKHVQAYNNSKNPQTVQLWLALLEIYKRQEKIMESVNAIEQSLREKKQPLKKSTTSVTKDLENY